MISPDRGSVLCRQPPGWEVRHSTPPCFTAFELETASVSYPGQDPELDARIVHKNVIATPPAIEEPLRAANVYDCQQWRLSWTRST